LAEAPKAVVAPTASPSSSTNSELTGMRKQLIVAQASLNEAIRTINEQNKEVANLRSQITDVKNSGDALPSSASGPDEATQKQLQEKATTISTLQKQVQALKSELAAAKITKAPEPDAKKGTVNTKALVQQLKVQTQQIAVLHTDLNSLKTRYALKEKDALLAHQEVERLTTLRPSTSTGSEADGVALDLKAGTALANAERHYQSAKTALQGKQLDQAIAEFREATILAPDVGRYAIDASAAYTDNKQIAEGIEVLTRYLSRNPSDREAYTQLGKLYLVNDQAEAATQAFNRAIPISTLNNYASALKKTNRMQDAESVFKLALALNPKDSEVLFNLGNLYSATDKSVMARDFYQKALVIRPDFAEAHYNLGLVYAKLGDRPQAVTHLEQFLKLAPEARNADTIKAYILKLKAA
jgi:tetratricopeptide (TPR) repeat protein